MFSLLPEGSTQGIGSFMPELAPRFAPLMDDELDDEQEGMIARLRAEGDVSAVSRAWVRHPRSLRAFNGLAAHVFNPQSNTLPLREREIVVLRTAWRCRSVYEWGRHLEIGRDAGLSDAEMDALKRELPAHAWAESDAALIEAVDVLLAKFFIPDEIWLKLERHWAEQQRIDVMMTVGMYALMGMFLNTARVPLESRFTSDPDFGLAI